MAAGKFLTQLLKRYRAYSVFAALSPTGFAAKDAADTFVSLFSKELQERAAPFVPTNAGLLKPEEVILSPRIDEGEFWEIHFSDVVGDVIEGKRAFLAQEEDGQRTRAFLRLVQIQVLEPEALLAFIEASSQQTRPPGWWYECYSYMANDEKLSRHDHSFFVGHKLIPTTDSSVIAVPDDHSLVVCLPPTGDTSAQGVPDCFSRVFVFLDWELATLLEKGKDTVRSWVLDRFRISRFEATDLLPRTIRGVVARLFSGELGISPAELRQAWSFIKKIIGGSRTILFPTFWQEMGRFPLPLDTTVSDGNLKPENLVPAFLAYWPDSFAEEESCLSGIEDLRRIDEKFLNDLVAESGVSRSDWIELFGKAGVSATPKLLKYSRIVPGEQDLSFVSGAPSGFERRGFSGERQSDENRAVVDTLRAEDLWDDTVASAYSCEHNLPRVLQSLTLLEGFSHCTQMAEQEYQNGDDNWRQRLWSMIKGLPVSSVTEGDNDKAFCRGGGAGGHSIPAGRYLQKQLNRYRWLPSSHGPASGSECFLRLSSRRLISSGSANEELGDKLLPYVAVDNLDDLARLQHLEVEVLDDAASASPSALVRALALLSERLSTEWGRKEILEVRSRWRLVRGAIQEIYRSLNQSQSAIDCPPGVKFATRSVGGVEFRPCPLYYAEPGSPVEQAFMGTLSLFDADRPYHRLFEQIGVTRLIPGQTVKEKFVSEGTSVPATRLRDEIVDGLAPFLLATIIARSEKTKQSELILRRLRERFKIKIANRLTVSFSLIEDPSIERSIDFPKFYLQRRLIQSSGAIEEAHYTLYVAANDLVSFSDLDADALGEALASMFLDGISDELAGLFPRIASRYHHLQEKSDAMEEFMYHQLGISREAQEIAWDMVSGEAIEAKPIAAPPPPPAKVMSPGAINAGKSPDDKQSMEEKIHRHQERLSEKTTNLVLGLVTGTSKKEQAQETPIDSITISPTGKFGEITPEQRDRGKRGEKEIKRRLELPGGWEGFALVADKRDSVCGYDFLCAMGEREVKLEIKTFIRNGRVVVTSLELQEAAASQDDYYLIGMLDDGKPEYEWSTFILRNPIDVLLTEGEFDIQAKLQASATDIFNLVGIR
ncbi:MAG: protein NO VEIN domain-containing protein [Candidatus Binatia bacterium]